MVTLSHLIGCRKKARAASRARTKKVVKGAVLEELHKEIPPLQAICIKVFYLL
jgi:hypothetical protein